MGKTGLSYIIVCFIEREEGRAVLFDFKSK